MFREILREMIADGLINKPYIARKVGVHVEVVEDIICMLVDHGYLSKSSRAELGHSACAGCHLASKCGSGNSTLQTYSITPKGMRYAKA